MSVASPALHRFLASPISERRLGPFVLEEQLGRGSFAPVWLAREVYGDTELRRAAVKVFSLRAENDDVAEDTSIRRRILEEARALCQVEHPNVVRFYALPIDEAAGVIGLAMEHVAGTSLDARLDDEGSIPIADTLVVGIAVASALAAVHRAGLVHRDVKPANVVEAGGVYKLIDFGIAAADAIGDDDRGRLSGVNELGAGSLVEAMSRPLGSAERPTVSGSPATGTFGYMDPVCLATGASADASSDLYALGAMLFECVAGCVPAGTRDDGKLDGAVLDGRRPPPPLLEIAPRTPVSLARAIDALLAPDRRARPASADEVVVELEKIRRAIAEADPARPPEEIGPFRGLGRFGTSDHRVFFGRADEIAAAIDVLRGRGLVAIVGSPGSGKSSLARAGVAPAVVEGAPFGSPTRWDVAIAEPGDDPRAAIVEAISAFVAVRDDDAPEALIEALSARARAEDRGLVLVVDQLDELATLAAGPSRDWAAALLAKIATDAPRGLRAVVTARRDRLDSVLAIAGLGEPLLRGAVLIEPLSARGWGLVIDQALAAYGYALEDDALRAEIVAELASAGSAMPLAQFMLSELWDRRDTASKKVTRAAFASLGGLAGAIDRLAEGTLAELVEELPEVEAAARAVFLGLAKSRPIDPAELASSADARAVADGFVRARLLVIGPSGATPAHDALIARWSRVRRWVDEANVDELRALTNARRAKRRRSLVAIGATLAASVAITGMVVHHARTLREAHEGAEARALEESRRHHAEVERLEASLREASTRIDGLRGDLAEVHDKPSKIEAPGVDKRVLKAVTPARAKPVPASAATAARPRGEPSPATKFE